VTVARAASRLIDRGDLVAALDRAAAGKVTVISAPAGGIAALVYGLSAAAPSGAFDVCRWDGAKVIAALAGAGYHPGRRPTNQMRRRCLH